MSETRVFVDAVNFAAKASIWSDAGPWPMIAS